MSVLTVIGIDPGLLRGTGLAHCSFVGSKRGFWQSSAGVDCAADVVDTVESWLEEDGRGSMNDDRRFLVAIETMAAMGPRTGLQKILDNAQFVGEIVGRLEERGIDVVQLKKLEILRALGIKGKASAARVRRVVEALFGDIGKIGDHEVDAIAAAHVGQMKAGVKR